MVFPAQADPTAVFGRRVVAAIIDAVLILVPVFMLTTAQLEYKAVADLPVGAQEFCDQYTADRGGVCINFADVDDRVYFTDSGMGGPAALYWGSTLGLFVLIQGLTGWTLGKLVMGIRLVREDGRVAGIGKALLRWVLWIVDAFPYFLPLVGFIVGLTTVGHRRVGDMAAKTFVVRRSAVGSPIVVPGLTAAPPAGPGGWATPVGAPPPPTAGGPQWDEARGTYIQWDPALGVWMQWDEAAKTWSPI